MTALCLTVPAFGQQKRVNGVTVVSATNGQARALGVHGASITNFAIVGTQGGVLTNILYATAVIDFPEVSPQDRQDVNVTVNGAVDGDTVSLGAPNDSVPSGAFSYFAWVSTTDTITIRAVNASQNPIDPGSGTFRVEVHQFK